MKTLQILREFTMEALLFQNPHEGGIIPNYFLGILAWGNILIIVLSIIEGLS